LIVDAGSNIDCSVANNAQASARVVLEFGTYNQNTLELWSKALRRALQAQKEAYDLSMKTPETSSNNDEGSHSSSGKRDFYRRFSKPKSIELASEWVSPGQDCRVTLHQSEIWCNRIISGDTEKAESELRRIIAMEKLVAQVTSAQMALLVYEKVSRVHELFAANSRREIESKLQGNEDDATREPKLSAVILNFFADHLKRKYSVFLILALTYGISEEVIREAHETMCHENEASYAGVGGGTGEELSNAQGSYGFQDPASVDLYDKYRTAALNYYKMNYGDSSAAEEEDAIMHLPVLLHVAIIRQDEGEVVAMSHILDTVKDRLLQHMTGEKSSSGNNEL